jgi:hypothetical protein
LKQELNSIERNSTYKKKIGVYFTTLVVEVVPIKYMENDKYHVLL